MSAQQSAENAAHNWGERWRLSPRRADWLRSLRCLLMGHRWEVNERGTQRVCCKCWTVQDARTWGHWCREQEPTMLPANQPRCPDCGALDLSRAYVIPPATTEGGDA